MIQPRKFVKLDVPVAARGERLPHRRQILFRRDLPVLLAEQRQHRAFDFG
jgi:hypothetical protein